MSSRLQKAIGAVKDQTSINLAKINISDSSNLQIAVLKATTHDDSPVNERYVYQILQLISSDKIYAAACARAIGKRITRTRNWIVALKSLMLVLRVFEDGDPYFPKELLHATKRGSRILNLSDFRHGSSSNWEYTAFVRMFGFYLDERLDCFLTGKLQRRFMYHEIEGSRKIRERTNEFVREMKPSTLIDRIGHWQRLLGRAVATRPTGGAMHHQLVKISLYAVVRESFDLYKDISDGLALLLDTFFDLEYGCCVGALRICIKAKKQFQELDKFYSECKAIGVGRNSIYPTVQTISEELIETLEEFLNDKSSFSLQKQAQPGKPFVLRLSSKRYKRHHKRSQFFGLGSSADSISDQTSESGSEEDLNTSTNTSPNSMIDVISLTDWPSNHEPNSSTINSRSGNDWELILPENVTAFEASGNNFHTDISSNSNIFPTTAFLEPQLPPINDYDPFLRDPHDIPTINFDSESDFEATIIKSPAIIPVYWEENETKVANDPLGIKQNEEKIIARHTVNF